MSLWIKRHSHFGLSGRSNIQRNRAEVSAAAHHQAHTPYLIFFRIKPMVQLRAAVCVKILLVDDSKPILHENERVLHKAGYEVVCAEDGLTALKMARAHKPDLILLDMILPKMSGQEVLSELKKDAATVEIAVVVLSSLTEKNREKLIEAGAEEYLEKNSLMSPTGTNLLPKLLEDIICRLNRKRGIAFRDTPTTI
jgi:CheY-like chemotaxis protein